MIKKMLSVLLLILAFVTLFLELLLISKIGLIIMILIFIFLLNCTFDRFQLFRLLLIVVLIIAIPFSYYFGHRNYEIKANPILFEYSYNETTYTFNNYESTFYVDGNGEMINFNGHTFIEWKNYLKGIKHVVIGDEILSIGNTCFYGAKSLIDVKTSDNIYYIGSYAFINCNNLSKFNSDKNGLVILPERVISLGDAAFYGCDKITKIYIPLSLTILGQDALNCTNLTDIYYEGTEEDWKNIQINDNAYSSSVSIHFSCDKEDI